MVAVMEDVADLDAVVAVVAVARAVVHAAARAVVLAVVHAAASVPAHAVAL